MTEAQFWVLIRSTVERDGIDVNIDGLEKALTARSSSEIVSFERILKGIHDRSRSQALWGAAYLIQGGCSDDAFDYFRGWLIAMGPTIHRAAVEDPDSLALVFDDAFAKPESASCEEILYCAQVAHEAATGRPLPDAPVGGVRAGDDGDAFDFDDPEQARARYPRLFEIVARWNDDVEVRPTPREDPRLASSEPVFGDLVAIAGTDGATPELAAWAADRLVALCERAPFEASDLLAWRGLGEHPHVLATLPGRATALAPSPTSTEVAVATLTLDDSI